MPTARGRLKFRALQSESFQARIDRTLGYAIPAIEDDGSEPTWHLTNDIHCKTALNWMPLWEA